MQHCIPPDLPVIETDIQSRAEKKPSSKISDEQAIVIHIIRQLIQLKAVGHTMDGDECWWHINSRIVAACAPEGSCANHPMLARWLIRSLHRANYIELKYFQFNFGCRMTIRLKNETACQD